MLKPVRYKSDCLPHLAPSGAESRARMHALNPNFTAMRRSRYDLQTKQALPRLTPHRLSYWNQSAQRPGPAETLSELPQSEKLRALWRTHQRAEGWHTLTEALNLNIRSTPYYLPLILNGLAPAAGRLSRKDHSLLLTYLIDHFRERPRTLKAFIYRFASHMSHVDFGGVAEIPNPTNGEAYVYDASGRPILKSPGVNLDGMTLREFNANSARLVGSSFRETIFINASLDRIAGLMTDFTDANLAETFMWNAHFAYALFDGAHMANTDLREAIFHKCSLSGATLEGANIERASFTDCTLDSDAFLYTVGEPVVIENGRRLSAAEVTAKYRRQDQAEQPAPILEAQKTEKPGL